ncbi:hypothetical protein F383_30787 [Gossypium arboreum]|uniref:Uncharacterized protein n=1 Tax=Gossypium arboreum TaxID=29729 RepID=A0A0B0PI49_GOSAR|nr:hypothetical protein F383_30787 [Gossypium arboreum]
MAGVAENGFLSSDFEALLKAKPLATKKGEEKNSRPLCRTRSQRRRSSSTARPRGLRCKASWSNDMALGVGVRRLHVTVVRS